MKCYRLLKDLPGLKAGMVLNKVSTIFGVKVLEAKTDDNRPIAIFSDWLEEVEKPTDSIHWKPKIGDRCFILENANIRSTFYTGMLRDYNAWRTGKTFRTKEECEKARDRELAEVRLRRTSTFKTDFENGKGGWVVDYDHLNDRLECFESSWQDAGEPVRYETKEEAKRSIKENREDWLVYLGVEE